MKVFAISDLHLSYGVSDKSMDKFGWGDWDRQIAFNWKSNINEDDLVLIPGDISWATTLKNVLPDLEFINSLPGRKIITKGNHEYWWNSYSKVKKILPSSITALQNNSIIVDDIAICGTRLWDLPQFCKNEEDIKIYKREVLRLEMSLQDLDKNSQKCENKIRYKICMLHYPPFTNKHEENEITDLISKYNIDIVIFGHLHGNQMKQMTNTNIKGTKYIFVSTDKIKNSPLQIA